MEEQSSSLQDHPKVKSSMENKEKKMKEVDQHSEEFSEGGPIIRICTPAFEHQLK
jgi:hypothetical protein